MQLEKFVQSAIQQIAKGVSNASEDVASLGGRVNPHNPSSSPRLTNIDFDVALVVSEGSQLQGEGKVSLIKVFSLGGSAQESNAYQQTSRVKFTVAVELPKNLKAGSTMEEEQDALNVLYAASKPENVWKK
ncbi:hypothetical protein ACTG2W_02370 [Aeromonas sp. 96A]|uniref:hypothetical protein n=1 Tax=Aeromonas TaxID=642 RepID=UPI000D111145|nr:hypothetical protein [Aeromonas veronii]MCR3972685.1 hypothetical protein [Aeromonas veronii]MCR3977004.1 hypothetical protein [Aeromonas veronii]PSJ88158.1 hypothetical protein CT153_12835 [Aeromonas veronii]